MELTILTVPDCPHAPLLAERLAVALEGVLEGRTNVAVVRRVITDDREATRCGMRGSPTLLIDGVDPFADPAVPPSMSCRVYRGAGGGTQPVPSVAALRRALQATGAPGPATAAPGRSAA